MLKICIGFDPRETVAYHALCNSIMRQASGPVSFIPVSKRLIPEFDRGMEDGSTDFSFSRFLTPYLCGYQGQSIFMDCDMIVRCDIYEVLGHCDLRHDVFVVKHDYKPKTKTKFLGNVQTPYPKKNWSSFMVFNNFMSNCKKLTPELVSVTSGSYLHQFKWSNDERVGELPMDFNFLVGEYRAISEPKILHYTLGTPCFKEYAQQEFAHDWHAEKAALNYAE